MEKRRWRTRLIVVAVLAVLVLVFGPKKLGWLVPGPDEAVTGYVMYELFSGSGAHDPAGEGLEELRGWLARWRTEMNARPKKTLEETLAAQAARRAELEAAAVGKQEGGTA